MGGGNGYVDMWHWELDVGPGVVAGFNLDSGNDPVGNLDDEYSLSPTDRHDDDLANEVYGAWSHTDRSATGASGQWIFEFKRSLTTSDTLKQDIQFEVGKTYKMAIAYWDADELGEPGVDYGWSDAGHYATCRDPEALDFSWIDLELKTPMIEEEVEHIHTAMHDLEDDLGGLNTTIANEINNLTDQIDTLGGQIDSLTTLLYVAIGVAVVGILIGAAGVVFARKKT
ncbi:MAG: ethylbenzene dehydrogenase-related protein [Candidatus Bathyarchaeia archaeon]